MRKIVKVANFEKNGGHRVYKKGHQKSLKMGQKSLF